MNTIVVSVPLQEDLLRQIDRFVAAEKRSRVDLIKEATITYINRKQRWQELFSEGERMSAQNNFTELDVMRGTKKGCQKI
ncbi:MAG: ribbon-helix-helix protein, CopG family [Prevotellaceae bacterium]|jgi:metal-responsive CopG/Arc/MetJ family transcriptional regulator|nr:ribbon-helix-helix protein, CopG family [Prevotellaceae bacterium]